jgi:hypothetical protein
MAQLKSNSRVYGNAIIDGALVVSGGNISSSFSTGALIVSGGLGVNGAAYIASGIQNTPIGNVTASTGGFTTLTAGATTVTTFGSNSTGTITGSWSFSSTLTGTGTLTLSGTTTSITTLGTAATTGTLTLGGTAQTGLMLIGQSTANSTANIHTGITAATNFKFLNLGTAGAAGSNTGITIGPTLGYGNVIFATNTNVVVSNTAISTSTTTGALTVAGGMGIGGNLYLGNALVSSGGLQNTPIGNVTPSTALFTSVGSSGNIAASGLTVNNSATIGTTLGVTGNIKTGGILTDGYYFANGAPFATPTFTSIAIASQSSVAPTYNPVLTLANLPGLVFTTTQSNSTITMGMTGGTFATPSDFGLETGPVTYSQDLGSITGAVTEAVNLSKLAVDGVVPGATIVANSIPGSAILSNTDITTTGNVTAGAVYTNNYLFANGAPLGTALFPVNTIYELDDISNYTDGRSNSFKLTYNQANVTINSPFNLLVTVNGLTQPAFDFNLYNSYGALWGSYVLGSYRGYTIDSTSGNIKFANVPPINSQIMMRTVVGAPAATTKQYPFKAVDILLGF